jgi:NADH dehydrogenase/NADH:ubiquinone oxidoreductase subunit G
MEKKSTIEMTIDGKEVIVEEDMTLLEAAQQNDIFIPTLCHHPALTNWGGCRMCMVEVDDSPRLTASCVTPVRAGMEVVTSNDRIIEHRRTILEFIFAERNHNCMFCPLSGDCELQQMAYDLQMDHLTVSSSFTAFPTDITSEYMGIDHNRCILCGRCVRACHEIAGADVMNFQNRGPRSLIGFDLNETRDHSTCFSCGVCLQVCPTGAIFNRYRTHYAVKGHNPDRNTFETVCPRCGLLCPISVTVGDNIPLKVEGPLGGTNNRPDRGQLCYKGRFQVFKTEGRRLHQPMIKQIDGSWLSADWDEALGLVIEKLTDIGDRHGKQALFGIASASASNETLFAFKTLCRDGLQVGTMDSLDGQYYRASSALWKNNGQKPIEASWKTLPQADFLLLVGGNPYRTQPLMANLIREIRAQRTANVRIIIPQNGENPMCMAGPDLEIEQEKLPLLLKAFLNKAGSREAEDILKRLNLTEQGLEIFGRLVKEYSDSRNPYIIIGDDVTGLGDPAGLDYALALNNLKRGTSNGDSGLIILKPFGNSSGAWALSLPSVKPPGVSTGYRGGLLLLSDEAGADHPIIKQNKGVEFLAVIAPYVSETLMKKAQMLIPSPRWMEEPGTYCSLNGDEIVQHRPFVKPPEGVRETWQVLNSLGQKIGIKPGYKDFNQLSAKVKEVLA